MAALEEIKIGNGRIIKGDCLSVMDNFPDNHFMLGFTSPPYLNAINYEEHIEKLHGTKARWEREDISYEEYRLFLVNRFKALLRITQPGGHNVVNIAPSYGTAHAPHSRFILSVGLKILGGNSRRILSGKSRLRGIDDQGFCCSILILDIIIPV